MIEGFQMQSPESIIVTDFEVRQLVISSLHSPTMTEFALNRPRYGEK
jgi:hypothetical protein